MASIRPCNKCGERISIRQMPHGQWVAFDVATDDQHKCSKKKSKIIPKKKTSSKQSSQNVDYGGISLEESNYNFNEYEEPDNHDSYQSDIDKIQKLKNISSGEETKTEESDFNPVIIIAIIGFILVIIGLS